MTMYVALQLLGLIAAAPEAPARGATDAQPSAETRWTVDFADDHCRASRAITVSGKPATFSIRPPLDGGTTRISLSSVITNRNAFEPIGAIDFGDGLPPYKTPMLPALFDDRFGSVFELPPEQARRLRTAQTFSIRTGGVTRVRFEFESPGALARTLNQCVTDLRRRVGLDSATVPWKEPARPRAPLAPTFSSSKFWTVESREARTNQITVRLLVDRAGTVRECAVVAGSGAPALDVQTCQVFERKIRYVPAMDSAGKAVASVVTETIKWRR